MVEVVWTIPALNDFYHRKESSKVCMVQVTRVDKQFDFEEISESDKG